jgi:LDH2 family malate/lactate/ureidoglycolate dehydrogenase
LEPSEAQERIRGLGFDEATAGVLFDHFADAERRGKLGHGFARVSWLESQPGVDPSARPVKAASSPGFEYWEGRGALGYLTLAAICSELVERPPQPAQVVVARDCFPTGMLGYWTRRLAEAGIVSLLTATSPPRLSHPDGGDPLVGTNPLAIGIPNPEGAPVVADVSMAKAPHGDVIAGLASPEDVVPFGGDKAYKAFALAVGLELLVESFIGDGSYGIFLVAADPEFHPAPAFRELAAGIRLPGDR